MWIPKSVVTDHDFSAFGPEEESYLTQYHAVRINQSEDTDDAYKAFTNELKGIYAACR